MENEEIKQLIIRELPDILKRDPEVQEFILRLSREHFADKTETESRFDRLLEELRRERERSDRRWEENQRRWEENQRKWEENQRRWEENERRWAVNQRRWEQLEQERKRAWEENQRRWEQLQEERKRAWEENSAQIRGLIEALKAQARKHDQSIGALGTRWGLQTEAAFRNALAGILGDLFGLEVTHVTEYDATGEVFGRPEQVELDLILRNGTLIIGEIKSSMSKADMYLFERKARFYEKQHGQKADRLIVISPMVDPSAREVAERLGIEVYSYAEDAGEALTGGASNDHGEKE